jgi:hypothetical protein
MYCVLGVVGHEVRAPASVYKLLQPLSYLLNHQKNPQNFNSNHQKTFNSRWDLRQWNSDAKQEHESANHQFTVRVWRRDCDIGVHHLAANDSAAGGAAIRTRHVIWTGHVGTAQRPEGVRWHCRQQHDEDRQEQDFIQHFEARN